MGSTMRVLGIAIVLIAAGCGGTNPGGTSGPGGGTQGPATTPGGGQGSGEEGTATISFDGADVKGSFELKGGKSVKPSDTILAVVFTEAKDNVAEGYADLVVITLSGSAEAGSRPMSADGATLNISYSRLDAAGNDLFDHTFASSKGECTVAMETSSTGWQGTFSCASLADADGHSAKIDGTFNT